MGDVIGLTSEANNPFHKYETDRLDTLIEGSPIGENTPKLKGGRTGSRAIVIQALYESDASGHPAALSVVRICNEQTVDKDNVEFAKHLVTVCEDERDKLDNKISKIASQYPSEQMSPIDRNILRVALAESRMQDCAPKKVILNEAIELAKLFGSDSSQKFVNGVLAALLG